MYIIHSALSTILRFAVQFYALIEKAGFIVQSVTEIRGVDLILELKPGTNFYLDVFSSSHLVRIE